MYKKYIITQSAEFSWATLASNEKEAFGIILKNAIK